MAKSEVFEIALSVLLYHEGKYQVAHCLEMDLKGRGKNNADAMKELADLVLTQVSFAFHKKEPGLIYHPAEKKYFAIFERLRAEALNRFPKPVKAEAKKGFAIRQIPLPEPQSLCFAQ